MNNKECELNRIIDNVVSCCSSSESPILREDVLGKSRCENVVMTRCILVSQILSAGYSVNTAACVLHRTEQAIRNMQKQCLIFYKQSRAYRIAHAEATLLCKEITAQ